MSGCAHGPELPAGVYCVDCRPGGRVVREHPLPVPLELRAMLEPYVTREACAAPQAAVFTVIPEAL